MEFNEHDRVIVKRVTDAGSKVGQTLFRNITLQSMLDGRKGAVGMTGEVAQVFYPTRDANDALTRNQNEYLVSYDNALEHEDGSRSYGGFFVADELGSVDE